MRTRTHLFSRPSAARCLVGLAGAFFFFLGSCTWGESEDVPFAPGEPTSELPPLQDADEATPAETPLTGVRHTALPEVHVWGTLRQINVEGDIRPTITLFEALGSLTGPGELIALGNVAGLRGEISARGDRVHVTRVCEAGLCSEVLPPDQLDVELAATLLVATRVEAWHEVHASGSLDLDSLAALIGELRAERGMGDAPMPVLVMGTLDEVRGHVVDADALGGDIAGTCAERGTRLPTVHEHDVAGEIIAFHDPGPRGRIVDHVRPLHAHVVLSDDRTLHLDHVRIPAGTRIRIPQTER